MKSYRMQIPATVCLSLSANSEDEAITMARQFMVEAAEGMQTEWYDREHDIHDIVCYFNDESPTVANIENEKGCVS